jgi:hypothetical protein
MRIADFFARMDNAGFNRTETQALRRIEMTLQRWGERECGDSNNYESRGIERDEKTDKPFLVVRSHTTNKTHRYAVPDREKGALNRLAKIMESHPQFIAYHQGDCRGCNLYLVPKYAVKAGEDIGSIYTCGIAVCY